MKKFVSFFLMLIFIFSFSVSSFAEDEKEYNWSDVEPRFSELLGGDALLWEVSEVDATFYLPYVFSPVSVTETDKADGNIGLAVSDNNSNDFLLFSYTKSDGINLDTLFNYFSQNNYNAERISVNGIPAVLQRNFEHNTLLLTFLTQEDMLFQVVFSPLSNEALYSSVISSIRPNVEDAAETEPEVSVNPVSGLISK